MDPFLMQVLSGLGSGAASGVVAQLSEKSQRKDKNRLKAEQRRHSLAALIDSLTDQQTENRSIDLNRSLRERARGDQDMMSAAANARRALGG